MGWSSRALVIACFVSVAPRAWADDDATQQGRAEFVRGTDFVNHAQWAEALAAFERSAKLKPHAVVTYNIAACERALGHYTRSQKALRDALAQNDANGKTQLADSLVTEAKAQLAQIDGLLVTVDVSLDPPSTAVAVDGRPLESASDGTLVAGMRLPGPGEAPPAARFKLVMDPGVHVLTLSRKGYTDAVVNKTFAPGTKTALALTLDKLPSVFHVEADQASAVVTFEGRDVGAVPVDVLRPSGAYHVQVNKAGFLTYEATVTGAPGEHVDLRAKMAISKPSIFTRWWFWTIAGVVVAGAAVTTYFLVRQPPPPNGGGLGWSVPIP